MFFGLGPGNWVCCPCLVTCCGGVALCVRVGVPHVSLVLGFTCNKSIHKFTVNVLKLMMIRYNVFDFFLKTLWINIFGQVFPFPGLHDKPENMEQYTNLPGILGNDIWFFASKYVR